MCVQIVFANGGHHSGSPNDLCNDYFYGIISVGKFLSAAFRSRL
jgi:hypothetical protein